MSTLFSNTPVDDDCAHCPPKTENIIVMGSEQLYTRNVFWLKSMFLSCGFGVAQGSLWPPGWQNADRTTLLYVPIGYSRWQLLTLDFLRDNLDVNIVRCLSTSTVLNYLRNRTIDGVEHKIRNLVFFSHGVVGAIDLNYLDHPKLLLRTLDFTSLPSDIFSSDGQILSYACQTAQDHCAQTLADHFDVPVRAFYRKTFYGNCLRDPSDTDRITAIMREQRETRDGQKIDIPPEHEAFPHPGGFVANMMSRSSREEGTDNYALWRKLGAIALPVTGNDPPQQPSGMAEFQLSGD